MPVRRNFLSNRHRLHRAAFPTASFDAFGNLWGTLVMADIIFAITPGGDYREILNDSGADMTRRMDARFHAGTLTAQEMAAMGRQAGPVVRKRDVRRQGPADGLYRQPARRVIVTFYITHMLDICDERTSVNFAALAIFLSAVF